MNWVGAFAPGTYKGRIAHPPKAYKILDEKINKKENRKAIRSALSAVINENLVKQRGHLFNHLPLVIDNSLYNIKKTKDLVKFLEKLGLENELERLKEKNVRAGQGSKRNRKYRIKKGPLFVISKKSSLSKILSSIRGLDCVLVNNINVELLAPGGNPGRLTLFTKDAIEEMQQKSLFLENKPKEKIPEKEEPVKKVPEKKQVEKKKIKENQVKKVKKAAK
jgi:large subunit ribosomal protein L4e